MLTTIPFEEFMALESETLEGRTSLKKFNWDEFLKASETMSSLQYYLQDCNCKKLGEGSARAAYALKKGDVDKEYVKGPCALKIATSSTKGPAQNKAEVQMLNRYQHKLECFPKLYAYDSEDWFYMLVEVGTPLGGAPSSFVKSQFKELRKYFNGYLSKNELPEDVKTLDEADFDLQNSYEFSTTMDNLLAVLERDAPFSKSELVWLYDLVADMTKSNISVVKGVGDTLKYAQLYGGKKMCLGDFAQADNWAFVKRNGSFMLIPIDWGATWAVMNKYYEQSEKENNNMKTNENETVIIEDDEQFYGDGWDCDAVDSSGLRDTLRKLANLQYEIEHNRRSAANFGDTLEDLKAYILELADELRDAADWFPGEDEED